jgi:caffeoyl-CoA O-methyltransferase
LRTIVFFACAAILIVAAFSSRGSRPAKPAVDGVPPVVAGAAFPVADPVAASVLERIKNADAGQLAVSEEDGRFLRLLVASSGAARALEIGAAEGYSSIWIGLGLRETGGRLVAIERDPERARAAEANVRAAGLAGTVTVVTDDAFAAIPLLAGTFDFVFLDAWKPDYGRFFELVFPRLQPGGLFVAHNAVNKRDEMIDFITAVEEHPALLTTIIAPSGEGMSVSYKRR